MKYTKRTLVVLSLALVGCRGQIMPASPTPVDTRLRIFSETASTPLMHSLSAAYQPAHLLIGWDIQVGDLNALSGWLKNNQLSSQPAYALTTYLPPDSTLWSTPIGQDGLAIIVNAANPIANLTPDQLRTLFTGRVLNWKALGGTDQPISVVSQQIGSSDNALFQAMILGERQVSGAARLATTPEAMIQAVSADEGGIGYVSMGALSASMSMSTAATTIRTVPLDHVLPTPQTVSANQYALRSPLLFVGLKVPESDAYHDFFAWVQSPAGQAVVSKNYAPLAALASTP